MNDNTAISETCRCGAHFFINTPDKKDAEKHIANWRIDHSRCRYPTRDNPPVFSQEAYDSMWEYVGEEQNEDKMVQGVREIRRITDWGLKDAKIFWDHNKEKVRETKFG